MKKSARNFQHNTQSLLVLGLDHDGSLASHAASTESNKKQMSPLLKTISDRSLSPLESKNIVGATMCIASLRQSPGWDMFSMLFNARPLSDKSVLFNGSIFHAFPAIEAALQEIFNHRITVTETKLLLADLFDNDHKSIATEPNEQAPLINLKEYAPDIYLNYGNKPFAQWLTQDYKNVTSPEQLNAYLATIKTKDKKQNFSQWLYANQHLRNTSEWQSLLHDTWQHLLDTNHYNDDSKFLTLYMQIHNIVQQHPNKTIHFVFIDDKAHHYAGFFCKMVDKFPHILPKNVIFKAVIYAYPSNKLAYDNSYIRVGQGTIDDNFHHTIRSWTEHSERAEADTQTTLFQALDEEKPHYRAFLNCFRPSQHTISSTLPAPHNTTQNRPRTTSLLPPYLPKTLPYQHPHLLPKIIIQQKATGQAPLRKKVNAKHQTRTSPHATGLNYFRRSPPLTTRESLRESLKKDKKSQAKKQQGLAEPNQKVNIDPLTGLYLPHKAFDDPFLPALKSIPDEETQQKNRHHYRENDWEDNNRHTNPYK